jgi:hypothetical protein
MLARVGTSTALTDTDITRYFAMQDGLLNPVPCLADADYSFDETGILGFGPDKSASENSQTIVGLLADQGVPEIFSTLLCQQGGLLWVGGYNPDAATSAPLYTPLDNTQGYYLFDINAIGLGGQNLNLDVSDIKWCAITLFCSFDCCCCCCCCCCGGGGGGCRGVFGCWWPVRL